MTVLVLLDISARNTFSTFSLGETYNINHQRAAQLGALVYEQPTMVGLPMASIISLTMVGDITATVKRGNHRGLLYR